MTAGTKRKVIELKNVGVTYREHRSIFKSESYQALKNISFDIYEGETLGVIGRNGAGKSTLLRLLAGIIKPDQGTIKHHVKSVSLMALSSGFDPNLSGRQNAIISGMLLGHRKRDVVKVLDSIKAFSELHDFFEKPTKTYSSGMRARLAFSIAMNVSPDILLIDEVLGVGDAEFRKKAENALEEKIRSKITVVFVSHSEIQVSRLSNRIVWIEDGVVRMSGGPEEIYSVFNMHLLFSKYNTDVINCRNNNEFIIFFEVLGVSRGFIEFNIILIDKEKRNVSAVYIKSNNKNTSLNGPKLSPAYLDRYPKFERAKCARYTGGRVNQTGAFSIMSDCNGVTKTVIEIELKAKES